MASCWFAHSTILLFLTTEGTHLAKLGFGVMAVKDVWSLNSNFTLVAFNTDWTLNHDPCECHVRPCQQRALGGHGCGSFPGLHHQLHLPWEGSTCPWCRASLRVITSLPPLRHWMFISSRSRAHLTCPQPQPAHLSELFPRSLANVEQLWLRQLLSFCYLHWAPSIYTPQAKQPSLRKDTICSVLPSVFSLDPRERVPHS